MDGEMDSKKKEIYRDILDANRQISHYIFFSWGLETTSESDTEQHRLNGPL